MRIAIDYTLAERNPFSGMGIYVSEMVKNLKKVSKKDKVVLFSRPTKNPRNVFFKILDIFVEIYWIQFQIPRFLKEKKIDIAYFPNPPLTFFSSVSKVLTIPDLSFYYDDSMNFVIKIYLYLTYFFSSRFAQVITTFSENSKDDIEKILRVPSGKIEIISPAVKEALGQEFGSRARAKLLDRLSVRKPYLLSVPGTFIPRKNMKDLILAYGFLPRRLRDKIMIVLIGNNKDSYFKDFFGDIEDSNLKKHIVCPGYVSDRELVGLYRGAFVSITPSLYEGFGLPPLESMMFGTPSIVYNRSSLPEIVGNAGLIVNSARELAGAITKVYKNRKLRGELIKDGHKRCKDFSWQKSVNKLMRIFESLYEN